LQQRRGAEIHPAESLTRFILLLLWLSPLLPGPATAQPAIEFATAAQGRELLLQRDDYVRALAPLERRMHLKSAQPVDEDAFMRHQAGLVRDWPEASRRTLAAGIERLRRFIAPIHARWPQQILLVRTDQRLEDGAAFTRGNAIFLFDDTIASSDVMHYFLAHEAFHVLSRHDPELRERLYALLGFKRCDRVQIPERVARLRLTNPDAVETVHTLEVGYRGQALHVLPFNRFKSDKVDPARGLYTQMVNRWLLVDRSGGDCKVRETADGVPDDDPEAFNGLLEQVGRNTDYLLHPEEILADNFALMFMSAVTGRVPEAPSPDILERLRQALFGK
jgi:hypothetical protein